METTCTELGRNPGRAIAEVRGGKSVKLTSHGKQIGVIVPTRLEPMSGKELAERMRRHPISDDDLELLARNMEGLR